MRFRRVFRPESGSPTNPRKLLINMRISEVRSHCRATEAQIQSQFYSWWLMAHKGLGVPDARLLFMIPNGAYLGAGAKQLKGGKSVALAAIRFAQLKRQGFVQGVPDLFLAVPRIGPQRSYGGLWLELKKPKSGRLSDAQIALHDLLRASDYAVQVAYGFDEAVNALVNYMAGLSLDRAT